MKYLVSLFILLNIFLSVIPNEECRDFFCHSNTETSESHCENCQFLVSDPSISEIIHPEIIFETKVFSGSFAISYFDSGFLQSIDRPPILLS